MNMGFFKARYVRDYVAAAKLKAAVIWAAEIAAVLILGIVLAVGYGKITVMQEGSMDPTLNAGDVLLVDRMAYRFSTPKRGDIIVYKTGDDKKASTHIKRIIGLPGETVEIIEGSVYINGEKLQEVLVNCNEENYNRTEFKGKKYMTFCGRYCRKCFSAINENKECENYAPDRTDIQTAIRSQCTETGGYNRLFS